MTNNTTPLVSIYMGSASDMPIMRKAAEFLNTMQIPFEMRRQRIVPRSMRACAARRAVQNLKSRGGDVDKGVLLVNGAIPGPKGSVVVVRTAVKGA